MWRERLRKVNAVHLIRTMFFRATVVYRTTWSFTTREATLTNFPLAATRAQTSPLAKCQNMAHDVGLQGEREGLR